MNLQKTQPHKKRTPVIGGTPESEIRQAINHFHEVIRDANVDEIMACYAPDIVAFDVMPPLQFVGRDAYRKTWETAFEGARGDMDFKLQDLDITASENVGFCHSLCHWTGTMKDGKKMDMWMRWTECFEKIEGKWLITHENISVPLDMKTGQGLFDLKPEKKH